ncbi:MAG: 2-hydroxyacid dehydrogenase [Planctomycetota bacterium]|nr:2-hydroxyacid dehydrogenase [Planctomycetota bacterium]
MRTAVFSTKRYDRDSLTEANNDAQHSLHFLEPRLTIDSVKLAEEFPAVCCFVNDQLSAPVLHRLVEGGTRLIALRCAGFNNVDLHAAEELGLTVLRVPAYSPYAVAEHAVGMILTLNRKFHKAYIRVREGNFSLDGLLGFDLHGKVVGIVGTGKIGTVTAKILQGFGCTVLAHDLYPNEECIAAKIQYVSLDELYSRSDIVSLHCPLTPQTYHLINEAALSKMKHGAMLINTSRGPLIDALATISALKSRRLGYLGLDVYEEEADLFFEDLSECVIQDDIFLRLSSFPNVLITGHQAFFTSNALGAIGSITIGNITAFENGEPLVNQVHRQKAKA